MGRGTWLGASWFFKFFSEFSKISVSQIPNPTSLQRDVCYKMKLKNGNECSLDMLSISEIRSIQRPLISQRGLLHLQETQLQPNHPQRAFSRYFQRVPNYSSNYWVYQTGAREETGNSALLGLLLYSFMILFFPLFVYFAAKQVKLPEIWPFFLYSININNLTSLNLF